LPDDLIFDVGAHHGEDTEFYLKKGFRVVAIEANPSFCGLIKQKFNDAVESGQLTVVDVAISSEQGVVDFFVNEDVSVWGTTDAEWVTRNRLLGARNVKKIAVQCSSLSAIVRKYGMPRYCKIDIEGKDTEAALSLSELGQAPEFISIESEKLSWEKLIKQFEVLRALGYRKYKIIDQSMISFFECPSPATEGKYVVHHFEEGSSGLFGNELPGHWLSAAEAIEVYKNIFRGYVLNGDFGIFSRKGVFDGLARLQARLLRLRHGTSCPKPTDTLPPAGWYDTHASK
jgi:FkbM family methyltransferase